MSATALADLLGREADLYDRLLALLTEEEAALLAGDTPAVARCLTRTETLVLELRLIETSRESLVARLAGGRATRLRELPEATAVAVDNARARLELSLPRVERLNRRVKALLERSLALFATTLDLIREAAGLPRHYTAEGMLATAALPTIDGRA
ncbi:MAG: flagellar protein FlgN [Candidatus Rokubacteria bacterium]|nr:flagellar protein FlgN [Candidatus Rokubacteria bacterium]